MKKTKTSNTQSTELLHQFQSNTDENPLLAAIQTRYEEKIQDQEVAPDEILAKVGLDIATAEGISELTGSFKTLAFIGNLTTFLRAQQLKKLKDSKQYKDLGYQSFEAFCQERFNITAKTANEYIKNLEAFGLNTYKTLVNIGLREKDMKLLRAEEGPKVLTAGEKTVIQIDGEEIELKPQNKTIITELLDRTENKIKVEKSLRESETRKLKEAQSTITDLTQQLNPVSQDEKIYQKKIGEHQLKLLEWFNDLKKLSLQSKNQLAGDGVLGLYEAHLQYIDDFWNNNRSKIQ